MKFLVLDYETRSELDLKKCGAYEYSRHETTRIMCAAWRFGTREEIENQETRVWSPAFSHDIPRELLNAFLDPDVHIDAHNALFEQCMTANCLARLYPEHKINIPVKRWTCTAALAAASGLPRKLEHVLIALDRPVQKDMEGHKLMLKLCKPRRPTKRNPAKWDNAKWKLLRVMDYCKIDVDGAVEIRKCVPDLTPFERQLWELDQKINQRGFFIDRPLCEKVLNLLKEEADTLQNETIDLTGGSLLSALQRNGVLKWLEEEGVLMPDLKKNTVVNALKNAELKVDARRLLEIRQVVSRTSTKKYEAFLNRSQTDSRIRDILLFNAAVPTARWGGTGVNPQNFPRGEKGLDAMKAIEDLRELDLETLKMIYGDVFAVAASCLRGMIIATPGMQFTCADYSSIEARILFWLAEHGRGVRAFANNEDIYEAMARVIFNIPKGKPVTKEQRQVGKQAVLGCGYGMGHVKFKQTCLDVGQMTISIELAKKAVYAYRDTHAPVPKLWDNLERAATAAVNNPGKKFTINRTTWFLRGKWLFCRLPSGRVMPYYGPSIKMGKTPWGQEKQMLFYWGVNPRTKKWAEESTYGGKLAENCVQGIARDFMAGAMLKHDAAGFKITLTVHDEEKAEIPEGENRLEEFKKIMCDLPEWGKGCPIAAEGWQGKRYRK